MGGFYNAYMKSLLGIASFVILGLFLASCSTFKPILKPGLFYRHDVVIEHADKSYDGIAVLPRLSRYEIKITPKGEIDLMLVKSCSREDVIEKATSGWFKKSYTYEYVPEAGLEDGPTCPLNIEIFDTSGKHGSAFIDFEHGEYTLPISFSCNGRRKEGFGVGTCQLRAGLPARVFFPEPVQFIEPDPKTCPMPTRIDHGIYELFFPLGICLYTMKTEDGKIGRFTTRGYEGVLVRETE